VSPLASGAGHVAGGTTYGLLEGNSLSTSFSQSFEGLGTDIAIGSAISLGTTIGVCYANKISPWNGIPINTITANDLNIRKDVQRIKDGIIYKEYRHDGAVFHNNPLKQGGYLPQDVLYKEYVVPTAGVPGPGPQRIVIGNDGNWYYTPDHYDTFIKFQP
jgi:guanyl-specific ribonuclease Sa